MRRRPSRLFALALLVSLGGPATAQVNPFADTLDLTQRDIDMLQAAAQTLFENDEATIGETVAWSNPASGNSGLVSLARLFEHQGLPCKRVQHKIKQKTYADPVIYQFSRCRAVDGTWKYL